MFTNDVKKFKGTKGTFFSLPNTHTRIKMRHEMTYFVPLHPSCALSNATQNVRKLCINCWEKIAEYM